MSQNHRNREHSWRFYFGTLLQAHEGVKHRAMGTLRSPVASNRTREYTDQTAMLLIGVLHQKLGFEVQKPENLAPKHIDALAHWMNGQREAGQLLPATLAGYVSVLRKLCRWAGKPELVEVLERHLTPETTARRLTTDLDKTFEGNGVDIEDAILRAWKIEPWVGQALLAQHAFGLRRREAVQFSPMRDIDLAGGALEVNKGAKGGRPRTVPLRSQQQLQVCQQLTEFVRRRNLAQSRPHNAPTPIAPPDVALKTSLGRYSYVMQKVGLTRGDAGVTGHGLRAGFVCRLLQDLGITPVIKGGTGRHVDPQLDLLHHLIASEAVGHSRKAVIGAYAGSPGVQRRVLASDYLRRRGLLLPGRDARCVDINARHITEFLQRQRMTDDKLSSTEFDEVSREQ